MKFRHPAIVHGHLMHPVHGRLPIVDGVLEAPAEVGQAMRLEAVPDPDPDPTAREALDAQPAAADLAPVEPDPAAVPPKPVRQARRDRAKG